MIRSYSYEHGNSASGIDFPGLGVDVKVTSISQPQSSSPFKTARQKIFGLGYSLLVFVYTKTDDPGTQTAILNMNHVVFVNAPYTGDYQTTTGIKKLLDNDANEDDIIAFLTDRNLPLDDIEARAIAGELVRAGTLQTGYLTISNALQWRLQYSRVIAQAGKVNGIERLI